MPCAFISTGLCLWLRIVDVFLFLQVAPLTPCLRMRCPFSCAKSFMGLKPPVLRLVRSVPTTSVGSLPRLPFTVTGLSPRCLTRPHGAPVRFLLLFTCETFSTSIKVSALWVCSWRWVRGSSSPHLFSACSRGGGGSISPLCPLLRGSRPCVVVPGSGGLPFQFLPGSWGFPFLLFLLFYLLCYFYSLFVYFIFVFMVSQPKMSSGVVLWTHDMTSDWFPCGFPPRLPGHCRLVLAGSHDSLFLWYPAIDTVWLGPVFLALGSKSHLALRDSVWWSLSPGWCSL